MFFRRCHSLKDRKATKITKKTNSEFQISNSKSVFIWVHLWLNLLRWPGESPPFGQGVGGALWVIAWPAAGVAQVGVGQLVGDHPADEVLVAGAEGSLEDNCPARPAAGRGETDRNVEDDA